MRSLSNHKRYCFVKSIDDISINIKNKKDSETNSDVTNSETNDITIETNEDIIDSSENNKSSKSKKSKNPIKDKKTEVTL